MVSYYNSLPYPQKHSAANLTYPGTQPWQWPGNYHAPPNHQYLGDMDSPHAAHHQMYYNPHAMFHSAPNAATASEWHSPTENFVQNAQMLQQHQLINGSALTSSVNGSTTSSATGGTTTTISNGPASSSTQLNETSGSIGDHQQQHQRQAPHITVGLPSPPITVSGSEISSPGAPASSSPHNITHHLGNNNNSPSANNNNNNNSTINNNHRSSPLKSHQYFDWMKKPTYPAQPAPGKTRTKDKYRVVYTDYQRLELEKEYCTSRYITIRRKTELAEMLALSERQVKIWFQNRRAKERKITKKDPSLGNISHSEYCSIRDAKPKLEPGLHLQHSLHSINSMAMSMPSMRLHPHLHTHPLAVTAHSHQLHQSTHGSSLPM